jgi:hypothetical protein
MLKGTPQLRKHPVFLIEIGLYKMRIQTLIIPISHKYQHLYKNLLSLRFIDYQCKDNSYRFKWMSC